VADRGCRQLPSEERWTDGFDPSGTVVGDWYSGRRAGNINRVEMVNLPPSGVNLHALLSFTKFREGESGKWIVHQPDLARFVMICLRRVSSPTTMPSPSGFSFKYFRVAEVLLPCASYAANLAIWVRVLEDKRWGWVKQYGHDQCLDRGWW